MKVLITGATGNVGAPTLQALTNKPDIQLFAAVTQPDKYTGPGKPVYFNFSDPESVSKALAGVDKLFLLRPPQISDVKKFIFPVIDQARRLGIRHIVFLSLQGVEGNKITPHYKIEQYILNSGLPYTFLRPSFFMQNLSTTHREEIRQGRLFIPAGKGKTNFVDAGDLGQVAAMCLANEGHEYKAYELTGDKGYDYYEVCQLLSEALSRPIIYQNPGAIRFLIHHIRKGTPLAFAFVMLALYTVARLGKANGYSPMLKELLGRKPTSLPDWIEANRQIWQ